MKIKKNVFCKISKKYCNFKRKINMAFTEIRIQENSGIQTIKIPDNF